MQFYTLYDEGTGIIKATMQGTLEDAQANSPYIEGQYSSRDYTVVDGVPVEKEQGPIELEDTTIEQGQIRTMRNGLLSESDWTQLPNSPADSVVWESYRQLLRDLPIETFNLKTVVWPTKPE
jgi:hypothetical protein|tara:strand:- start:59 stop:424 length:366 start_codon:yes stop_codon:yes gene_type:complete